MDMVVIVDSISGLNFVETNKKKWGYIPLFLKINNKEYADGISINDDEFYSIININDEVSTSSSNPQIISQIFDKLSKQFDYVIYIPISKYLSSQYEIAALIAREYKNVHVVESNLVSIPIIKMGEYITEQSKNMPIDDLLKKIEIINTKSIGYIIPKTLKWLKKGGRISPSIAALADLMSIVPIIKFNGKMEKCGKGRVPYKALIKMTKKLFNEFGNKYNYYLLEADAMDIINKSLPQIKEILGFEPPVLKFPRTLVIHVGIGSTAIYAVPKIF